MGTKVLQPPKKLVAAHSKAIAACLLPWSSAFLWAWSTSYMCSNCMAHGVDKIKFDVFSWNSIIDANVGCRIFGTIQHANWTFPFLPFFPDLCASIEKEAACSGPSIQWQLKSHLLMTFYLMDFFTLFASKCLIKFYKQISKSLFHFKIPRHPKYTKKKIGFNQYFQRQKCFLKICKIHLLLRLAE